MANEFSVRRVAAGTITFPANAAGVTVSTLSAALGVNIPKGALVTGVKLFPEGAITNGSNLKNATVNIAVGGQVIGTNNRVASQAFVETVAAIIGLAVTDGVFISAGGPVVVQFASSDSARTGVAFTSQVFVEYLYA